MTPSYNHSYVQAKLTVLFGMMQSYNVHSELTLYIEGKDYTPDISIYPKKSIDFNDDIVKVTEMPLLVVEILSPTQGTKDLVDKFNVYFQGGIKSCWLVQPYGKSIMVWSSPKDSKNFIEGEIVDEVLDVKVPVKDIFS